MSPIEILTGCLALASGVYTVLTLYAAIYWRLKKSAGDPSHLAEYKVTIMKPVCGTDPEQRSSFESFCKQDHTEYQIIFGALDPEDVALQEAKRLVEQYPALDITLVAGGKAFGHNRKVCNLLSMLPHAKHDLLVLCDSDMRVTPDYIQQVTQPFSDPNVGLVTCLYRGSHAIGIASRLEALGIGADFAPSALLANRLEGMSFAMGSTIAIRRSVLEEIGGFAPLVNSIADDYLLGNRTRNIGYHVVLSNYVVADVLGKESLQEMWYRRLRWARTMRAMRPAGWFGAGVSYSTVWGLSFAASTGWSHTGLGVFAIVFALRACIACGISLTCTRDRNVMTNLWLLPISDLLAFALWVGSFLVNRIQWRGEYYYIGREGNMFTRREH